MAILHTILEMRGYMPNAFEQSVALAAIARKLHFKKVSVDKAADMIETLIKNEEIVYEYSNSRTTTNTP